MEKPTQEMLNEILQAASIEEVQKISEAPTPDPIEYFLSLLKEKNLKAAAVFRNAGIDDSYGRHLINKDRRPNRNMILKLALSAGFSLKETQNFLKYASHNDLYAKDHRDQIIIFAIKQKYTVMQANESLYKLGYELLSKEKN